MVVSPRVRASYRPQPGLELTAAYGRGLRPPEARAFSDFQPEREGVGEELSQGGEARITTSDALEEGEYHYASVWFPEEGRSELPALHTTAGAPRNLRVTLRGHF